MTHVGLVRSSNEDHYLLCTLHHTMTVHGTSLADADRLPLRSQRLATVAMVADGVGGAAAGSEASRLAVASVAGYVSSVLECLTAEDPARTDEFRAALETAAFAAHDAVRARAAESPELQGMATTLTLMISTWPHAYVVQVGFAAMGIVAVFGLILYNRFFSHDTPDTNRRARRIMLGIYALLAAAGVWFLQSTIFTGETVAYKTLLQSLIMLAMGAGGLFISLRKSTDG